MLERGGYMEHGGIIAYANNDYENKIGTFSSMLDAKKFAKANKWRYETILFEDENGDNIIVSKDDTFKDVDSLFADSFKNGGEMAKGGDVEMLKGKYVNIFSMGVKNPISTDIIEAKMSDPTFRYQTLSLKTRGGGEERIEGKEKINDFLKGKMVFVRDSSEEYGIQLIDTFAKGGNVYSSDDAYEVIILKDGVEVDRVVLRAKNKGEARMMYEDYHEGKMMKNHGEDITYEIIVAPSKMANGGEVFYKESHKMGH
jgi:predicted GNAT superfamily acetyltransferase